MRAAKTSYLRLLSTLIATSVTAALPGACADDTASNAADGGGADASNRSDATASSGSSGSSASSGGTSSSGSSNGSGSSSGGAAGCSAMSYEVDAASCEPQLQYVQYENDAACSAAIEQPCVGDAGVLDACAMCRDVGDGGIPGSCSSQTSAQGQVTTSCGSCCIGGRAPRGFVPRRVSGVGPSAARLAEMAQLEAASIDAFHALHAELERLGAPKRILAAVLVAAEDEVRHARSVGRVAERLGAEVPGVSAAPIAPRSIEQLAIDNAGEACVMETFGAALARIQAARASDPAIRRVMSTIAREELQHAALAWRIAGWLGARLDEAARGRVRDARLAALRTLEARLRSEDSGDELLGVPDAATLHRLLRAMWEPIATGDLMPHALAA